MENQTENMNQEVNQEEIKTKKILFWNVKMEKWEKAKKIVIRTAESVAIAVVMAAGALVVLAAKANSTDSETTGESGESIPMDGSCASEDATDENSENSVKE